MSSQSGRHSWHAASNELPLLFLVRIPPPRLLFLFVPVQDKGQVQVNDKEWLLGTRAAFSQRVACCFPLLGQEHLGLSTLRLHRLSVALHGHCHTDTLVLCVVAWHVFPGAVAAWVLSAGVACLLDRVLAQPRQRVLCLEGRKQSTMCAALLRPDCVG